MASSNIPMRPIASLSVEELAAMRSWALGQVLDATGVHLVFASDAVPMGTSMSLGTTIRRILRIGQQDVRAREKERARELAATRSAARSRENGMVFGASLESTVARMGAHHGPYRLLIPKPLSSMIAYVEHPDRVGTDGIFRVPGAVRRITDLRVLLENEPNTNLETVRLDSGHIKVYDIAALIKSYIRLLPESIMTDQFERVAASACKLSDNAALIATMQLLYLALPPANRDVVEALFRLMNSITLTQGRMNATNLALVWAPCFMSPKNAKDLQTHRNVVEALKVLISSPDSVFACDLWLVARHKFGYGSPTSGFAVFRHASLTRAKSLTRSLSQLSYRSRNRKPPSPAPSPTRSISPQHVHTLVGSPPGHIQTDRVTGQDIAGQDIPLSTTLQARRSLRASSRFMSLEELATPDVATAPLSVRSTPRQVRDLKERATTREKEDEMGAKSKEEEHDEMTKKEEMAKKDDSMPRKEGHRQRTSRRTRRERPPGAPPSPTIEIIKA